MFSEYMKYASTLARFRYPSVVSTLDFPMIVLVVPRRHNCSDHEQVSL